MIYLIDPKSIDQKCILIFCKVDCLDAHPMYGIDP